MTANERAAAYRELFRGQLDAAVLKQIRQASNQGMALGNERFRHEIERLAGRRVVALKEMTETQKRGRRAGGDFTLTPPGPAPVAVQAAN